jgi:hypothetical protein
MAKGRAAGEVAEGAIKVFPVGKLLRRAKGLRNNADEAATAARRGVDPPRRPRNYTEECWKRARKERDDAHADLVAKKQRLKDIERELAGPPKPDKKRASELRAEQASYAGVGKAQTVTGATDPETGISKAGWNHKPKDGSEGWGCAEKMALDEVNAARAALNPPKPPLDAKDVDFSDAREIMPDGSYKQKPVDGWCQNRTNPEQFPDDVEYYPGGGDARQGHNTWDNRYGL